MQANHARMAGPALFGLVTAALVFSAPPALAQGPSPTDHFKCYGATEATLEQPTTVTLTDQFGVEPDVMVENARWFCNPVTKIHGGVMTPITEFENHLTLYPISNTNPEPTLSTNPDPARLVTISSQFGIQDLVVTAPRLLAIPTTKVPFPPFRDISYFKCYKARSPALNEPVTLRDQFGIEEGVRVLAATFFCNPAVKIVEGVPTFPEPLEAHLACYKITPSEQPPVESVNIFNQFEPRGDTLTIGPSQYLCVPSEKLLVGTPSGQP